MTLPTDLTHERRHRAGPAGKSRTVILPRPFRDELIHHAREEWPHECCGALLGLCGDTTCVVTRVVPAANIAGVDRRDSYQIDWGTLLRVTRAVRDGQADLVGFYHSHPDGSARPSRRDRETAWIDYSYVIVPLDGSFRPALSSWRVPVEGHDFEHETLRSGWRPCSCQNPLSHARGSGCMREAILVPAQRHARSPVAG